MTGKMEGLRQRFYGDGLRDGTQIFYQWLRKKIRPDFIVLNIGAGNPPMAVPVSLLKNHVRQVIGVDVSERVLENPNLNQAVLIDGRHLPFPDGHFDLAWADYTMEHVGDPLGLVMEIARVLKPNGSFFFRTPNRRHYVSLAARWIPFRFHQTLANQAQGFPKYAYERFPTLYRFNSHCQIVDVCQRAGFQKVELRWLETEPTYLVFHPIPYLLGVGYERLVNRFKPLEGLRVNILGRLER